MSPMCEHDFNPYDLNCVAKLLERDKLRKEIKRTLRNKRAKRKMSQIKKFGSHVNPYDLGQMS